MPEGPLPHDRPQVLAIAQAFKGTLEAPLVGEAFREGIRRAGADANVLIGSDGGDGLLTALGPFLARSTHHSATGPLGDPVEVPVGWLDAATAVIESRLVIGLTLVEATRRDPARTTTRGVGELIEAAIAHGAQTVLVGLGGSATMDGGLGMARALGWVAVDAAGHPTPEGGGGLRTIRTMVEGRRPAARIVGLFDVRHLLLGADGAARFARQKGASAETARELTDGLATLARAAARWNGHALAARPGAGAAGGLAYGLAVFAGAELVEGAPWVLDRIGFTRATKTADLILTGEGAFDETSVAGKLTGAVLVGAARAGVPAGLLAPSARDVPSGVLVETGPGRWTADDLTRRTDHLVRIALRLPGA